MLMHIVLFTFKAPWSWASLEAIDAERSTRAHPNHIEEIKGWTCGRNITRRNIAADFVVIGLFENRETLDAYIEHPNHQIGVAKWRAIADWTIADIELTSDFTLNNGLLSVLQNINTDL
ncbi:stress responsive protein [Chania multitudinisentens RB-25]|uniref:Stress responsive protein n=1 Tax=Chania multitudinisentens RB-25 TaxID=1441930 RepID=W0LI81_9GAMM|nr:Dabb family protein [Chania multitudinisentens]AHG21715.1 stress responsive protein [Chania multitudinisentens RB-25]